jgi:hypothetical protein
MDKIKKWCSNKENLKILFMIVMAIILLFVLKKRFGGTGAENPDSSAAHYENRVEAQSEIAVAGYDKRVPTRAPDRSKTAQLKDPEPSPFLKRDLFSSRYSELNPKRNAEEVEKVDLELKATIIDGQGALAIIGKEVLVTGEKINGLRVTAIKENEVVLSKGKKRYVLRIKEE